MRSLAQENLSERRREGETEIRRLSAERACWLRPAPGVVGEGRGQVGAGPGNRLKSWKERDNTRSTKRRPGTEEERGQGQTRTEA